MKKTRPTVFHLTLSAMMTACVVITAQISFPVFEIPFTASILGVMLCGLLLPPSYAVLSLCCYIALGAAGVPVFASFTGGAGKLLSATGGFILSYPFMGLLISFLSRKTKLPNTLVCILSLPICYALGTVFFVLTAEATVKHVLNITVWPFVPLDIAKCILAALLYRLIKKPLKL